MEPGRLARRLGASPLEESVGRHHASALDKGLAKGAPRLDRLGARVDILGRSRSVFGPGVNQSPARGKNFAILEFDSDDVMHLRRRDVIARPIIDERIRVDAELRREHVPVAPRDCEAPTHLYDPVLLRIGFILSRNWGRKWRTRSFSTKHDILRR